MSLAAYPNPMRPGTTSLVVFQGLANMPITWAVGGSGTLSHYDTRTNAQGAAKAVFTPTAADQVVTLQVTYNP